MNVEVVCTSYMIDYQRNNANSVGCRRNDEML